MAVGPYQFRVRTIRFGCYELDRAGELRKFGARVKLQNKPFLLLLALVERPGEIVTRSELQEKLWPGTFVDFERNLNIAAKKVRDALCDSANDPKFIETVPGQGYRFIAPVEHADPASVPPSPADPPRADSHVPPEQIGITSAVRVWMTVAVLALVISAALGAHIWHLRHVLAFMPRGWVLIAHFENRTGEPLLDGSLEAELARELAYSKFVNVVPPERVYDALRLMKRAPQYPLDPLTSREVCLRDGGIQALLYGRVSKVGSVYEITIFVENPQSGVVGDSFEQQANGTQQLVTAMHSVADKVRERLGEEVGSVRMTNDQLLKVTSPSLESVQLYSRADAALRRNSNEEAEQLLKRALEKDPTFASAWNLLGWTETRLGHQDEELADSDKAFQMAATTSDREAYFIRGSYYQHRHDYRNAIGNYEALLALYPDDWWSHNNLWFLYLNAGREKDALRIQGEMAAMRPTVAPANFDAWCMYTDVNDYEHAAPFLSRLRNLIATGAPIGDFGRVREVYASLFEKTNRDDWKGALAELDRDHAALKDKMKFIDVLHGSEANFYISIGRLHAATAAVQAMAHPEDRSFFEAEIASERGDDAALKVALDSFLAKPGVDDRGVLWHFAARAGLKEEEQKLSVDFLSKSPFKPAATLWQEGVGALEENQPREAIDPLTEAIEHFADLRHYYYFYAAEDLSDAYERTGDLENAIRTLEPLERDHRIEIYDMMMPTHARYHLWQLYQKTGRATDAAKLEAELSELAKYADPDHPYLSEFQSNARTNSQIANIQPSSR
jgi:DNA-binding winged helix-turn-helix (wHTH) protein/tetratricopeptide (TPR) repeat protein